MTKTNSPYREIDHDFRLKQRSISSIETIYLDLPDEIKLLNKRILIAIRDTDGILKTVYIEADQICSKSWFDKNDPPNLTKTNNINKLSLQKSLSTMRRFSNSLIKLGLGIASDIASSLD